MTTTVQAFILLAFAMAIIAMAKWGGLRIWHAVVVLLAGGFVCLAPLTNPYITSFLSSVTKGRFP